MPTEAWITLAVIVAVFVAMARGVSTPDVILLAGAVLVAVCGIITPAELLRGFSNPGMLTIAALFVVAAGLRETGALDRLGRAMLGGARTARTAFRFPIRAAMAGANAVAMRPGKRARAETLLKNSRLVPRR